MNPNFDLSRWLMLISRHWSENRKRYLLSLLAMAGLLLAWYSFVLLIDQHAPYVAFVQYTTYYCGLYFVGCLYAGSLFSELGNKAEGLGYLLLPASHLEKLLCALLFGVLLFFIAYTLLFYMVDIPMVHLGNNLPKTWGLTQRVYYKSDYPMQVTNILSRTGPAPAIGLRTLLLGYFAIQSVFILGSVYFSRYSFIKTTVAILLFLLVFLLYVKKIVEGQLPDGWALDDLLGWHQLNGAEGVRTVSLPAWIEHSLYFLIRYSIPFIFWSITYQRLKEKEL